VEQLRAILRKYWGYDEFRPLQQEAMRAVTSNHDSVVVLPTGGGKSLCFQAPALAMPGLAVVVSPLISLMKDQVDSLTDCGVAAACVNSSLAFDQRRRVADEIRVGRLKLLYLSPERLMTEQTLQFLQQVPLSFIAIDEAHCISDWGHDFRPEYRMLRQLKDSFQGIALHAYTATATQRVRDDIVRELRLAEPEVLVGSFDRPNLVYRVQRRSDRLRQIRDVIDRHKNDSGIIYCIRRSDVEEICASLTADGRQALPYHAGMSDDDRRKNQDAFINDRARIIVATVAFGMGIDKSDVRYVIHAAAPKSLEAYQQESGRAGRDGLEAECCLFYSAADFQTWRKLQQELPPQALEAAMTVLAGIEKFAGTMRCRHQAIVGYFGQQLDSENCKACDVCLAELDLVEDSLVIAQKIISCVLRLKEAFGLGYTSQVLTGSRDQRILENGHDQLSTWGLLNAFDKRAVGDWIDQLVDQGFLQRSEDEYPVLKVTAGGRRVLKGEVTPQLLKPADRKRREAREQKAALTSWEGVDRGLFEELRSLRRRKADERGLPPFIIFSDATLRDMARRRPSTPESLLEVHGIGERKSAQYGDDFLKQIADYCQRCNLATDTGATTLPREARSAAGPRLVVEPQLVVEGKPAAAAPVSGAKKQSFDLFAKGETPDAVAKATNRSRSTVVGYLREYIEREGIIDPGQWLDLGTFKQICLAADEPGIEKLKPIFEALEGKVSYDEIGIALACLRNQAAQEE
jgi:ATP-dependent DNA helicase RecQ